MGGVLRPRGRTILPVLLCLSWAACSRPAGVRSADGGGAQATEHSAPFREGDEPAPHPETAGSQEDAAGSEAGVPFHDSQSLPAGTLLTVRLKNAISSDLPGPDSASSNPPGSDPPGVDHPISDRSGSDYPNSNHPNSNQPGANGKFLALVDEPVIVEGTTVVPRGASVAGRIESTRFSTTKPNHGYVRLTLDLVDIAGRELPIRTSSLFARGNAGDLHARNTPAVVSLEQGRRLTFRLTEPVYVVGQSTDPHR